MELQEEGQLDLRSVIKAILGQGLELVHIKISGNMMLEIIPGTKKQIMVDQQVGKLLAFQSATKGILARGIAVGRVVSIKTSGNMIH